MNNKNIEIANLVFNWLKNFGEMLSFDLTTFYTDGDTQFSLEYLQNQLSLWDITNIPENADSMVHIYIEQDSDYISLIDDETWHNNPSKDQDDWLTFSLELPDLYFTIHLN